MLPSLNLKSPYVNEIYQLHEMNHVNSLFPQLYYERYRKYFDAFSLLHDVQWGRNHFWKDRFLV